ncbi:hypothetical protein GMMP1_40049 [Candidatus Magnetomoraceae bacterium gMMP-1]
MNLLIIFAFLLLMPSLGNTEVIPELSVYKPGFTIPVVLNQSIEIESLDMKIKFDSNVLQTLEARLAGSILEKENYALQINKKNDIGELILIISANRDLFTGKGQVVFIDFEVIGEVKSTSPLSFISFDCNELSASGGFYVNHNSYKDIKVIVEKSTEKYDLNNDRKIGIEDAIYALQSVSGIIKYNQQDEINIKNIIYILQCISEINPN